MNEAALDGLFAEVLRAGPSGARQRAILERADLDEPLLVALLRRPLPEPFLTAITTTSRWSERTRVLGAVVRNPRTPRHLALRLAPALYWRDLAEVAANAVLEAVLRVRAESLLAERLELGELRLGDRLALARLATSGVLRVLLQDLEPKVPRACLENPRLLEQELVAALGKAMVPRSLIAAVADSERWAHSYAVRLALVLQPRTPLSLSLGRLSALRRQDLERVAATRDVPPLVQRAALRVAAERPAEP